MRALFCALLLWSCPILALDIVIANKPESDQDRRNDYSFDVLREALRKTEAKYGPFEFRLADMVMQRASLLRSASNPAFQGENDRLLFEIKRGELVNVAPLVTRPEWEKEALPVRIPVDMGLMSYRIFLINRQDQSKFSAITNLDELKHLRAGTGETWSTYRILQQQGFTQVPFNTYEGMFQMLAARRFDYITRGVNEAFLELHGRREKYPEMAIEESIALFVPSPRYFFVSPAHPRLAKRLEDGMKIMVRDGSLKQIFLHHYGQMVEETHFCQRRIFRVDNPLLSKETPLDKAEYWFNPWRAITGEKPFCQNQKP